jgi:glycosyltransferase involved in cell wall biosynthesis
MISIIIPVLNAEKYLGPCLSALQALNYPSTQRKIIVVDNGSTDRTVDIAREYDARVMILPGVTVAQLRNAGAALAQGRHLAFIDADCVAPCGWLTLAASLLADEALGAVGCWYTLDTQTTFWERVWSAHMSARQLTIGNIDWVPSGNLIISKNVFDAIGGFDETLTTAEDVDICRRIHEMGLIVYSHPGLAVVHLGEPKSLKQFLLKEKWRGEGVLQTALRQFPHVQWNKAITLTAISLLAVVGILTSLSVHDYAFSVIWLALLVAGPAYLTLKACLSSRQWRYCLPLMVLFLTYALARILSAFNPRVWKT